MIHPVNNKLLVLIGQSGVGKSYVRDILVSYAPHRFLKTSDITTRAPRSTDIIGDYIYVCREEFQNLVNEDELIEHRMYDSEYYGQKRSTYLTEDKIIVGLKEAKGAIEIKKLTSRDVIIILLLPPSINTLSRRNETRPELFSPRHPRCWENFNFAEYFAAADKIIINDKIEDTINQILLETV